MAKFTYFNSQSTTDAAIRFGDRLRRMRKAQGRTLADLEASTRIHRHTIARLEQGDTTVSFSKVLAILESLGELADIELLVSRPDSIRPRITEFDLPLDRDF